jgi:transitional endoplasmic reticulum ATPase
MEFIISGQIKRKFEPIMQKLSDKTRDILKTSSIYKGTAIRVDLDFMDTADKAPTHPEFMELGDISDSSILLSEQFKLEYSSVLLRIEKTRECYNKNITLKHGCLLAGPYGTGKTLTARWTAKKAVDNRWTYLYVENSTQLRHALRLAELYAPAVVFTEDIDKAMEGDRSVKMNEILNTLDGIDTKSHPIITILTTNHVENINKAFLRAGRIDKLIHMGPLDKDTALKFINQFTFDESGESMLIQDEDFNEAAEALAGIVPAFASEVISQAKMYSLYKTGDFNKITSDDIKYAAQSFKDHIKLTENKKILSKEEEVGKTFSSLFESVTNNLQDAINDIKDDLNDLRDRL